MREKPGLSQTQFAALMGTSPRTLQNWEQTGKATARALLRVAEFHPEVVLEALHRSRSHGFSVEGRDVTRQANPRSSVPGRLLTPERFHG